jgi:hypothetical protein
MKNFKYAIIGLLVGVGAFAVTKQLQVDRVNSPKPQHFVSGIFLGTDAKNPLQDVKNKQAKHLCFSKDYDFPALGGTAALDTVCAVSSDVTMTGCGFNDAVTLAVDQAPANAFGTLQGRITAASTGAIVACAPGITDGGSFNQPDSGFTICCDGYQ